MSLVVRRALPDDVDAAADVLADAFEAYAWELWTVAADRHKERIRELQHSAMTLMAPYCETWVAEDSGEMVAVAAWVLPGAQVPAEIDEAMLAARNQHEGDRHEASLAADAEVAAMTGRVPGYFLATVGVLTSKQHRGYGQAVLAPVLDRLDAEGQCAQLETSSERNVRFYRQLGFEVTDHITISGGGPDNWLMTRQPRG